MKFSEKYENPSIHDEFEFEGDSIIYTIAGASNCCVCGDTTNFYSLNFLAYFCSEECNRKMWNEYFDAMRKSV